ncbi:shikimate dehydrogenase [Kineosporia succinea]|uniref:Shikimate dehydrogenase n=1 Tax=Kineosporia succinea TaxID=84632 RepID=A0ABT9PB44_9ACTN|nr:shikimate dehydrogenase [Kineosporia succinea]MDP9829712.1 shikimate dehydrogenase [Kineosporia succinea]
MGEHRFLVGLIGSGVGPSLTPALHMRAADRLGLAYIYRTVELGTEDVSELLRMAEVLGFDALNITHPVKTRVLPYLDELDDLATELGSVNTVLLREGRRLGRNTDWTGFTRSFRAGLPDVPLGCVALVGAGGAGMSVGHALLTLGVRRLRIVDVRPDRAHTLADRLAGLFPASEVTAIETGQLGPDPDGFVHCTPTGMAARPGLPFDPGLLQPRHWVADIVYRPLQTELLRTAAARGCRTLNGSGMTVHQALETFTLITGRTPDAAAMTEHFRELVATETA